jgi:hypothetical protein
MPFFGPPDWEDAARSTVCEFRRPFLSCAYIRTLALAIIPLSFNLQLPWQSSCTTQPNRLSINISTFHCPPDCLRELLRLSKPLRKHNSLILQTPFSLIRHGPRHTGVEYTWCYCDDANTMTGEVTSHWESHGAKGAFGGGIGGLTWLAFELCNAYNKYIILGAATVNRERRTYGCRASHHYNYSSLTVWSLRCDVHKMLKC